MASSSSSSTQSSHLQSIVDSLPPEIVSTIAASLDSQRLVLARRVCPKWLDTIDADRSLFKTLDLSSSTIRGWNNGILQLFDQKSHSKLAQVELPFRIQVQREDLYEFVSTLRKSVSTLSSLSFSVNLSDYSLEDDRGKSLFSLLNGSSTNLSVLCINNLNRRWKSVLQVSNQNNLRSLPDSPIFLSLSGFTPGDTLQDFLNQIFKSPGRLGYLHISFPRELSGPIEQSPVQFNHLKVLEASFPWDALSVTYRMSDAYPKLILFIQDIGGLYSMSRVPPSTKEWWLKVEDGLRLDYNYANLTPLFRSGPRVRNLRIDSGIFPFRQILLVKALEERFKSVGSEIDGEPMRPLEKLIISKKHFGKTSVSRLEDVVGEVIDVKDVPDRIQIPIPESSDRVSNKKSLFC